MTKPTNFFVAKVFIVTVGFLFLVPAVEPVLVDLTFISKYKYILVALGVIYNLTCMSLYGIRIHFSETHTLIFIIAAILLVSSPFSTVISDTLLRVMVVILILLYLFSYISLDVDPIRTAAIFGAAVSWVTAVLSVSVYIVFGDTLNISGNFRGMYYNSNVLGMVCSIIGVPSIMFLIHDKLSKRKARSYFITAFVYSPLLLTMLYLIFLSRSRAAMLSLFVAVLVFYLIKASSFFKYTFRFVAPLFFIVMLGLFITTSTQKNEFVEKYILKYSSNESVASVVDTRLHLWNTRLTAIEYKPLLGWGYGVNPAKVSSMIIDEGHGDTEKGNSILALIEEFGIVFGFPIIVLYLLLLVNLLYSSFKCQSFVCKNRLAFVSAVAIGGFIHSNFESWLFYFGNIVTFFYWWLIVGASLRCRQQKF